MRRGFTHAGGQRREKRWVAAVQVCTYCDNTVSLRYESDAVNIGERALDLYRALHCTNSDIYRWKREGITIWRADQIAVDKLGVHPAAVWGDMWWEAADREAA